LPAFAQDLREAIKGLQAEQACQHGALSSSKERLSFLSARLQACMASTEDMTQQQAAASVQLQVPMRKYFFRLCNTTWHRGVSQMH
jgi:hypothetical protein